MISRRCVGLGGLSLFASALAGCAGGPPFLQDADNSATQPAAPDRPSARPLTKTIARPDYQAIYGAYPGEHYPIAGIDFDRIDPRYLRQTVEYPWSEPVGSVVIDPPGHHLYFVEAPGRATRYGVGVGREGFVWSGDAHINMKRDWPDWVPPSDMMLREPEIRAKLTKTPRGLGVPGGLGSPLGARAMYLFGDGRDLGYRIHGTWEPYTIGSSVSSGCIRMVNQDIVNVYTRVALGTHVTVLS